MLKHRHLRPSIKIFLEACLVVVWIILTLVILFNAVLQKSYQMSQPTIEELQENPSLVRYSNE